MVAVHFTAIPCEPNAAHIVQGKPYFGNICPYTNGIVYAIFEGFRTIQYVFMSIFCALRVMGKSLSVPVAILLACSKPQYILTS